jgi:hypothetical protein
MVVEARMKRDGRTLDHAMLETIRLTAVEQVRGKAKRRRQ